MIIWFFTVVYDYSQKARPFILENYQTSNCNFTFLANFQHLFGTAVLNTFWLYAFKLFLY